MAQNRFVEATSRREPDAVLRTDTRNRFLTGAEEDTFEPPVTETDEGGSSLVKVGVGAGALAGAAALAAKLRNAGGAIGAVGKAASGLNALRQQLMLSGFALPKSVLGNVGAAAEASIEGKSLRPLKELFSTQTVKDAARAYKQNTGLPGAAANAPRQATIPYVPTPGRIMGALDEATQGALRRSGMSGAEAERATLQAPLQGNLAEALDSPAARYVHPFRRTPFNQFIEGWQKVKNWQQHPGATAAYTGAGAVHGAATADDDLPMSVPLAIAGSARYGLPYGLAALLGRSIMSGKGGGGIASNVLPVGEYGLEQSISDPLRPFKKPAAFTALERITGR